MTAYQYHTLIVPADRDAANGAAAAMGGPADMETFTGGLSPSGDEPTTHYLCVVAFTTEERVHVEGLKALFLEAVVVDYNLDREPDRLAAELVRLGLQGVRPPLEIGG